MYNINLDLSLAQYSHKHRGNDILMVVGIVFKHITVKPVLKVFIFMSEYVKKLQYCNNNNYGCPT